MQRGFTLIELLVVVAIISLLASIVMYSTSEAKLKADDAHMKAESDQVAKAIHLYKAEYAGKVPGALSLAGTTYAGQMLSENDPDLVKKQAYQNAMQELVDGGYLPEVPRSPDGASYSYMVTTDGESAVFAANLKTKSSSGSGGNSSAKNSCEKTTIIILDAHNNCSEDSAWLGGSIDGFYFEDYTTADDFCNAYNVYHPFDHYCFPYDSIDDLCSNYICGTQSYSFNNPPVGKLASFDIGPILYYYVTCEIPSQNGIPAIDVVCGGFTDTDYCQCI